MTTSVLCSGRNDYCKFGTSSPLNSICSLSDCTITKRSNKIERILIGDKFIIYSDAKYEDIFMAGNNKHGQVYDWNPRYGIFMWMESSRPVRFGLFG